MFSHQLIDRENDMKSLISRFKASNVAKVGSAYVLVAWVIIQLNDSVLPTFEAPSWVGQTIIFLLILGLPITLVIAWASQSNDNAAQAGKSDEGRALIDDKLVRRLLFVGGPSAAIAGLITFFVMPTNEVSEVSLGNVLVKSPTLTNSLVEYTPETKPVRSSLIIGQTRSRRIGMRTELGLSQDGSRVVFNSYGETGGININLLELDSLEPVLVQDVNLSYDLGYCNCGGPSFSPDGEWILYIENSLLHRVRAEGSAPQEISDVESTFGAYWTEDNNLLFTNFRDGMLYKMTSAGRSSELIEGQVESNLVHSFPFPINASGTLIYTVHPNESVSLGDIYILDASEGSSRLLIEDGFNARYAPSGHIVFIRDGSLWAVPFDVDTLEIVGEEVPVVTGIETWADRGLSNYAFSNYGRLVYLPGEQLTPGGARVFQSNLIWLNKDGSEEEIDLAPQAFSFPEISPDGSLLALTISEGARSSSDIWVYDFARKTLGKRTFSGLASRSIWNSDGSELYFRTVDTYGVANGIWSVPTNGTGSPEMVLLEADQPLSTTPDDTDLIYSRGVGVNRNIFSLSEGVASNEPLFSNTGVISNSRISPDGNWITYVSVESGINQIYVHPYPDVNSGKWQISISGGNEPIWSADSSQIYFIGAEDELYSVTNLNTQTEQFSASLPEIVLELEDVQFSRVRNYSVHPSGEKFLFMRSPRTEGLLNSDVVSLVMVENWFEELKRLAPSQASN